MSKYNLYPWADYVRRISMRKTPRGRHRIQSAIRRLLGSLRSLQLFEAVKTYNLGRELGIIQFVKRFVVGSEFVSLSAIIADIVKPKSLGGLFGAVSSVAPGTLVLTVSFKGSAYASIEARSISPLDVAWQRA
jgi:hypothetical protein